MSEQSVCLPENNEGTKVATEITKTATPIPSGMLKSGRVWKKNQTKKSSQFATNGVAHIKTSWELKQEKRLKEQRTKELQRSMKEAKAEAQRVFSYYSILISSKNVFVLKNKELEEFRTKLSQHKCKSLRILVN